MKKYLIILSTTPLLLIACGGGKKQTLGKKEEPVATVAVRDSLQESIVVYNAAKATAVPQSTEQPSIGARGIDANNPPIKLNIGGDNLEQKEIDLADYFEKVRYVKIKHPLPKNKGGFLGNAKCDITYTDRDDMAGMWNFNSSVFVTDKQIVAGDEFFGYHVYDLAGKFIYTVAQPDILPTYNAKQNHVQIAYGKGGTSARIYDMNVVNNKALISIWQDSLSTVHIYDLEKQKGETSLLMHAKSLMLVDSDEFIEYNRGIRLDMNPIMTAFNTEGRATRFFKNHNPPVEVKGMYTNPELIHFYYYENVLTVRQAYNDTIYRMKAGKRLEAAYVLDMGKKKLETKDAFTGSKEGKLIFAQWMETDKFIHICFTENFDSPKNRDANVVKYVYFYYDKAAKKLYTKTLKEYPETYLLPNNLEGAIPTLAKIAKTYKDKLYTSYTKEQLAEMMEDKKSSAFSESQKGKIKELHDSLDEQELLIMILE